MVSLNNLQFLTGQKKNDAAVLLKKARYVAAIYFMGYAVEIALKRKICHTLRFNTGFPENSAELQNCISSVAASNPSFTTGVPINFTNIREIKNHDLNKLLRYTGKEFYIKSGFSKEWISISFWNPEQRYTRTLVSKKKAIEFIRSASVIIREIN